jgi:hypothetical protein
VLTRVALVWSENYSGCETKPTAPGPALGISRLESSVGWAIARRPLQLPAAVGDTASHRVRVGHPIGQDDVWHGHAAKSMRSGSRRVTDHLLDPGLGANWPHCQVR